MACTYRRCSFAARGGTAAPELAAVLPFLGFIFVIALDYRRILYLAVIEVHVSVLNVLTRMYTAS
jgi:hypothetical protein